jgi:hypothetical protein
LVQQNDPFSELLAGRAFRSETGLLAVRNTRFEKQSSIYSSQMSKPNSTESHPEGNAIRINLGQSGCFRAVLN